MLRLFEAPSFMENYPSLDRPFSWLSPKDAHAGLWSKNFIGSKKLFSVGALIHAGLLILTYAMSDTSSSFATVPVDRLLAAKEPV
jgi:hypothetical protein